MALCNTKRKQWSPDCSDEYLDELRKQWVEDTAGKAPKVIAGQKHLVKKIGETVALYTTRRDARSKINGKPVMQDFLGACMIHDEPLPFNQEEYARTNSNKVYTAMWGEERQISNEYNDRMRCPLILRHPSVDFPDRRL